MRERVTEHIPADEVDVPAQARPGRPARHRVHHPAAAARARADRRPRSASAAPSTALDALADRGLHRPRRGGRVRPRLPLPAAARAPPAAARPAAHPPDAARPGRAARARPRRRGLADTGDAARRSSGSRIKQRGARPARAAVLPPAAVGGRRAARRTSCALSQRAGRGAARGDRLPRPARARCATSRRSPAGVSRRATIQRHLLPVMLQWFADGADPDYGLLAFRRLSDDLGETLLVPADAARLVRRRASASPTCCRARGSSASCSSASPSRRPGSRTTTSCAPRSGRAAAARRRARSVARHADDRGRVRSRCGRCGVARCCALAMAAILGIDHRSRSSAEALTTITEVTIQATLRAVRRDRAAGRRRHRVRRHRDGPLRRPGARLRLRRRRHVRLPAGGVEPQRAHELAQQIVRELRTAHRGPARCRSTSTSDLRPEGKNGADRALARLVPRVLRAAGRSPGRRRRCCARAASSASVKLLARLRGARRRGALSRRSADPQGVREVKRIKARVENERLPQGADPARHLKLGRGSLSDVEWFVQLLQLQHAHDVSRAAHDLDARRAARRRRDAGLVPRVGGRPTARGVAPAPAGCGSAITLLSGADRATCCRPTADAARRRRPAARVPARLGRRRSKRTTSATTRRVRAGVRAAASTG